MAEPLLKYNPLMNNHQKRLHNTSNTSCMISIVLHMTKYLLFCPNIKSIEIKYT